MNRIDIKNALLEATETESETAKQVDKDQKLDEVPGLDKVKELLSHDIFNHSAVMRELWGSSDDTNRSLFLKKLEGHKNESGFEYAFTKEEVEKINGILMNTSSDITHALGNEDVKKAKIAHKQRSLRNQ